MSKPKPGLAYTGIARSWPDDGTVPEWIRFGLTDLGIGCSDDGCRAIWAAYQAADDCVNRDGFTPKRIEAVRSGVAAFVKACDTSSAGRDGKGWLFSVRSIIEVCDRLETAIADNNALEAARWGGGVGVAVGVVYELHWRNLLRRGLAKEKQIEAAARKNADLAVERRARVLSIIEHERKDDSSLSQREALRLAEKRGSLRKLFPDAERPVESALKSLSRKKSKK